DIGVLVKMRAYQHAGERPAVFEFNLPDLIVRRHEVARLEDRLQQVSPLGATNDAQIGTDLSATAIDTMAAKAAGQLRVKEHSSACFGIGRPVEPVEPGSHIVVR